MKNRLSKFIVCILITIAFVFADVAVTPVINPAAVEVQAASTVKISAKKTCQSPRAPVTILYFPTHRRSR